MAKAKKKAAKKVLTKASKSKVEPLIDMTVQIGATTMHPGKFTPEKKAQFIALYSNGGTVRQIAEFLDLSPSIIYRTIRLDAAFKKEYDIAMESNTDAVEDALHAIAMRGNVLAMFGTLKARRPAKWRENIKVDGDLNHNHSYAGTALAIATAMNSMEVPDVSAGNKTH